MQNKRSRGFTIVELLVVVSIIALLIGILLPAIAKARDAAKVSQSRSNIRNVWTALQEYENDWGVMWTGSPPNLAGGNPDLNGQNTLRTGMDCQEAIGVWNSLYYQGTQPYGIQVGEAPMGGTAGVCFWNGSSHTMSPYTFSSGLTTSALYPRLGTFRFPNTRQVAEYINDDPLDKTYFAPKDTVPLEQIQVCFEFPGSYCPSTGQPSGWPFEPKFEFGLILVPSSYCLSPAAMFHPKVYEYDANQPDNGFKDPMSFGNGFVAPSLAQAQFSDLKTYVMEHNWLNNLTSSECGANWGGTWMDPTGPADYHGNAHYDGCAPWHFNHSFRSAPVTTFTDGHVDLLEMSGAERNDVYVQETGGGGLWHRNTGDGTGAYWIGNGSDWTNVSVHTHTIDGIRGRDWVNK